MDVAVIGAGVAGLTAAYELTRQGQRVVVFEASDRAGGLASGFQDTLLIRAGDIALRMRRPLVVVPRETPLSLPAVENMAALLRAGAVVLPPCPAFYPGPQSVGDIVDFIVGRILDVLGIENDLYVRWGAS